MTVTIIHLYARYIIFERYAASAIWQLSLRKTGRAVTMYQIFKLLVGQLRAVAKYCCCSMTIVVVVFG